MSDPWSGRARAIEMHRRGFLKGAAAATLPLFFGGGLLGQAQPQPALIARQQNPDNLEFPFNSLSSFITPNDLFYVRNHFAQPQINANDWRLRVGGAVQNELSSMSRGLKALGFDINFAPVADVWDGIHPFMSERSYGQNPQAVSQDVTAAIAGIHAAGDSYHEARGAAAL